MEDNNVVADQATNQDEAKVEEPKPITKVVNGAEFTDEQLKAVDAQVQKAVQTAYQKAEAEKLKAIEDAKAEATLNADELAQKRVNDENENLKQELANEKAKNELASAKELLAVNHLPASLAEVVAGASDKNAIIESLKQTVDDQVREKIDADTKKYSPTGAPLQNNQATGFAPADFNF
jgi:plasmid maintenance system killer protein